MVLGENITPTKDTFVQSSLVTDDTRYKVTYIAKVCKYIWRFAIVAEGCIHPRESCIVDPTRWQTGTGQLVPVPNIDERIRKKELLDVAVYFLLLHLKFRR